MESEIPAGRGLIIVNNVPELEVYRESFEEAGLKVVATFSSLNEVLSFFQDTKSAGAKLSEHDAKLELVIFLDNKTRGKNDEEDRKKVQDIGSQQEVSYWLRPKFLLNFDLKKNYLMLWLRNHLHYRNLYKQSERLPRDYRLMEQLLPTIPKR